MHTPVGAVYYGRPSPNVGYALVPDDKLFSGLFGGGHASGELTDRALLQAMLDFELALSRALVNAGLVPAGAAEELARACDANLFSLEEIGRSAGDKGTPVPGMLSALRARVGDEAAASVHLGATSQDVVDSAVMLVAKRALGPVIEDLRAVADTCAVLADRYRGTVEAGRTLLQQALPVTFGLKAATWLSGLDGVLDELIRVREEGLAVQLGGAVGTLSALGDSGLEVVADVAGQLGLPEPDTPWHTVRLRPARLACALAMALGAMGTIARDIVLLAQTEVAEAAEGGAVGRGGSSTMPHKRNPVGSVAVLACAQRGPGLAATILSAMVQEHERAAGAWQAEWETLIELLRLAGSASASLKEVLDGLIVDPERMRANLERTGELLMSESVAVALSGSIGRPAAQKLVEEAVSRSVRDGRSLRDVLIELPEVAEGLGTERLDAALEPERYLGVTGALIDRALARHA